MAISRPLLLALLGMVLLSATFLAVRNSRERVADDPGTTIVQEADEPAQAVNEPPSVKSEPKVEKSEGTTTAGKKPGAEPRAGARKARPSKAAAMSRAIADGRVVVLFVYDVGADDQATAQAVSAVKKDTKAAVFRGRLGSLAGYGPIVADAGVTQTPSVVVIDRKRQARVIEGYVDPQTLLQEVADAR